MELLSGETLEDRLKRARHARRRTTSTRSCGRCSTGWSRCTTRASCIATSSRPTSCSMPQGHPTLIDFGASRAAMAGRTTAMTAIFTPGYAAAEQMTSAKQGPWTDIYGLSATLYHAITGQPPPSAFDRMLTTPTSRWRSWRQPASHRGLLAGIDAGLALRRERPAADHRRLAAAARHDAGAGRRRHGGDAKATPSAPHRPVIAPSAAAGRAQGQDAATGLWVAAAGLLVALLGGGGYYAYSTRGPDPEMVKARAAGRAGSGQAPEGRGGGGGLRAADEKRRKEEQAAAERQAPRGGRCERQHQIEDEARRKFEAELAEQKRQDEEARRKQAEELEARRKAIEFVPGDFDAFRPDAPADRACRTRRRDPPSGRGHRRTIRRCASSRSMRSPRAAPSAMPADRPPDGWHAALSLPDHADRRQGAAGRGARISTAMDLALALVRNGLVLASCDAPTSYADAEDDARSRQQSLWGRVKVQNTSGDALR